MVPKKSHCLFAGTAGGGLTYPTAHIVGCAAESIWQVEHLLAGGIVLAVGSNQFVCIGSARGVNALCLHELIHSRPEDGFVQDSRLGCRIVCGGIRLRSRIGATNHDVAATLVLAAVERRTRIRTRLRVILKVREVNQRNAVLIVCNILIGGVDSRSQRNRLR